MNSLQEQALMPERNAYIFENSFSISNFLLKLWMSSAQKAMNERGRFNVALSGGQAPVEFYARLSGIQDLDLWKNTHLFQTDERFVSADNLDSNSRLLKNSFIQDVPIPPENIHLIDTSFYDCWKSSQEYQRNIQTSFKLKNEELPVFDLILLGIGEDGHTASLFPNTPALNEKNHFATCTISPRIKHERISLTFPVINAGKRVVFLATGERKSLIIHRLITQSEQLPVNLVKPNQGSVWFILDHWAAKKLTFENYEHEADAVRIKI
jgi:6-phosphogluconolactonase